MLVTMKTKRHLLRTLKRLIKLDDQFLPTHHDILFIFPSVPQPIGKTGRLIDSDSSQK
jgi:hypothetical protein